MLKICEFNSLRSNFPTSGGQQLRRNGVVVSVYAFLKNPSREIGPGVALQNGKFREFSRFTEMDQEASRELLGHKQMLQSVPRACGKIPKVRFFEARISG